MLSHVTLMETLRENREKLKQDSTVDPNAPITDVDQVVTILAEFLQGLVEGMSFSSSVECSASLTAAIYYAQNMYDNRLFYIPSQSMQFALSSQKLTEAYNNAFSFCDASHIAEVLAQLTAFESWMASGQLASRLVGLFTGPFQDSMKCIKEGNLYLNSMIT